jgi:signal transduction histidine kinase
VIADRTFDDAQRMRLLADVAGAVAWAPDAEEALRRVAGLVVPRLADWCAVDVRHGESAYQRLTVAHGDARWHPRLDTLLGPWPLDPRRPGIARVLHTGEPQVAGDTATAAALVPHGDAGHEQLVGELGVAGYLSVPLGARREPLGALTLVVTDARRRFVEADVALVETLARVAGLALSNADLVRQLAESHRRQETLLATLSHQLRTPLTAMLGWLHLARHLEAEAATRALDTIERNGRVLSRLVDDLLDTMRILTGLLEIDRRPVDLAHVVARAAMSQRQAARDKGVQLDTQVDAAGASGLGDRLRLEQVVTALLANAVKYTPAGGRIAVRLDADAAHARIRVSDTGRGITPELLPHVFELFRHGSDEPEPTGLGLGLALARGLVTLHGGSIEAASEGSGRGATFTVLLPLAP